MAGHRSSLIKYIGFDSEASENVPKDLLTGRIQAMSVAMLFSTLLADTICGATIITAMYTTPTLESKPSRLLKVQS